MIFLQQIYHEFFNEILYVKTIVIDSILAMLKTTLSRQGFE